MADDQHALMNNEKEEVKKNVGDFYILGRYTAYICLLYELLVLSQVSNLIYMIFGGAAATVDQCGDEVLKGSAKERCLEYESVYEDGNKTCTNPVMSADFKSVNYEFGYACGRGGAVKLSTSIQMIGIMFGAVVFGQLSDAWGRRKTLMFGTVGLIISGLVSTFAPNLTFFTIARIFVMFFTGGKHSVSYVFMMENLPGKHRMWLVTVITYSPNYIVFALIAYLCGEWRWLSRVVALLTILPGILLCFANESPRWLIQKGRIDEARKVLINMGKWDKLNSSERLQEVDAVLDKERERLRQAGDKPQKRYSVVDLFSTRTFAFYTILFAYSLMITSIISYGVTFNMEKLSGSAYLNTIILGSLRYAINLVCAVLDIKYAWAGRRVLHGIAMSFMAFGLLTSFIIQTFDLPFALVVRIMSLAVSAMGTEIYILNAVSPSELFPTAIRNVEIGFIQTFNRIGNIIAPQIFTISKFWKPLPFLVMCLMATVEVISYLLLVPETKGKPMPDRMPGEEKSDTDSKLIIKVDKNGEDVPLNDIKKG